MGCYKLPDMRSYNLRLCAASSNTNLRPATSHLLRAATSITDTTPPSVAASTPFSSHIHHGEALFIRRRRSRLYDVVDFDLRLTFPDFTIFDKIPVFMNFDFITFYGIWKKKDQKDCKEIHR